MNLSPATKSINDRTTHDKYKLNHFDIINRKIKMLLKLSHVSGT
jgi:hypothetical protein